LSIATGRVCGAGQYSATCIVGMRTILRPPLPTLSSRCVPVIHADTQPPQTPWYDWVVQWPGHGKLALDTPIPRARAPMGGEPRRRPMRKHLTFFRQKFAHPHPPLSNDVSHNSIRVDIGEYGCLWLNHVFLSLSSLTTRHGQLYSPLVNHVLVLTYLLTALLRRAIYP
jgi:hypothetical protein